MRKYTVTALHAELGGLIGARYGNVLVEGEVSQLAAPSSGHRYVTLRDQDNQLSAVVWKDTWRNLRYKPKEGDRVLCRGRLGVFARRGSYQLYVNHVEPAGEGDLARKIAAIKARLMEDGLLDPRRKRALPRFPRTIGVATSIRGAALQDFLKVSRQRHPATRILVADCVVQGDAAPASVIRAVELLLEDGRPEVIVVTRGGGSREDLMAFQDEQLARFLADCPVPVVSAVGHQVDTTIADLVADAVAPTPTGASEVVLPDGMGLRQRVDECEAALAAALGRNLRRRRERVDGLRARLRHPGERLRELSRRRTDLEDRLRVGLERRLVQRRRDVDALSARLEPATTAALAARRTRLERAASRLEPDVQRSLRTQRARLDALTGRLDALSPLAVLGRGYAIVTGRDGVVTDPAAVRPGEALDVRVHGGTIGVRVDGGDEAPQLEMFVSE